MCDTIAAVATGAGRSAIGIIRLSGAGALAAAGRIFRAASGLPVHAFEDRRLCYGTLMDASGAVLDHGLCTVSRGPASYTGEDTAELQLHGSPVVLRAAMEALFAAGARQARPGEFTKRAFFNGKLNLTQAEAVIDLIDAETAQAAKNAAGQLSGAISRKTDAIYDGLTDIMAHFHAVLDYPDEELDPFSLADYAGTLDGYVRQLEALTASFDRGRLLKEGVRCAIVGRPNTGKSSLLNALLGYDRAIVNALPGTTRDTIVETLRLGSVFLRLADTAGLRDTDDPVEKEGVGRALAAAGDASLVFAVFDGAAPFARADEDTVAAAEKAARSIAVVNKADLPQVIDLSRLAGRFDRVCAVSAKTGAGISALGGAVAELFPEPASAEAGEILTNTRHVDAVARARDALASAGAAICGGIPPDAVLTELEAAMSALGELTGKTVREDITARIFERFCVGK